MGESGISPSKSDTCMTLALYQKSDGWMCARVWESGRGKFITCKLQYTFQCTM